VAAKIGMSKKTFETNLSRFKKDFGRLVYAVVAETVDDPADIEDEIKQLTTPADGLG